MANQLNRPLIVTAELGTDFGWLEDLRQRHFPPERNQLRAHLTMFHAIPPSAEAELRRSFEQSAMPTAFVDPDGRVRRVNQALCELLGYAASSLARQPLRVAKAFVRTATAALELHRKDLEVQDHHGVRFLTYWFDEARGTAFCLIDAPDAETAYRGFLAGVRLAGIVD